MPAGHLVGEAGQGRRADGDAEDPQGQLDDAVGVVEKRDASLGQEGGEQRADEDVDLVDSAAEGGREHEGADPPHARMPELEIRPEHDSQLEQHGQLHRQLQEPPDHDADGQRQNGLGEIIPQEERRPDHAEVQDDGREGRRGEVPQRVQDPHAQGHERDEKDVGEHDPGEQHREGVLVRGGPEAGGHNRDDGGRKNDARNRDDHEDDRQEREGHPGQLEGVLAGFRLEVLREDGHEGDGERPLGKESPQQVRDPEGDEEGVRGKARAEEAGHNDIADESEDAREHRGEPHHARRPGKAVVLGSVSGMNGLHNRRSIIGLLTGGASRRRRNHVRLFPCREAPKELPKRPSASFPSSLVAQRTTKYASLLGTSGA